nr:hypothetical protein [Methanobacterium spitsbergense]
MDCLYALGRTFTFIEKYEESLLYYNKILDINANHLKALIGKSLSLSCLNKTIDALSIIDDSLQNSNNGYLWAIKGRLLSLTHENNSEVKNCFQKAFELCDDTPFLYYQKAKACLNELDYKKASNFYNKSIESIENSKCDLDEGIYVTKLLIMFDRGWMYSRIGDYAEALKY